MAFTELTEFLSRLDAGALLSGPRRAELVERLQGFQAVFLRLGASAPAAQLDLAAQLLRSFGDGDGVAECLTVVRRIVAPIEQVFQLQDGAPGASTAPSSVPSSVPSESRGYLKARLGVARDMLLGEMLVHFGVVTQEEVTAALAEKRNSKKRLGEILVQQGATSAEEIQRALAYQARVRGGESASPAAAPAVKKAPEKKVPEKTAPEKKPVPPRPEPALPRGERPAPLRMMSSLLLGEILFMQGAVTRERLALGMAEQRRSGRLLGEILLELCFVTRRQLEHALSYQGNTRRRSSARRAA